MRLTIASNSYNIQIAQTAHGSGNKLAIFAKKREYSLKTNKNIEHYCLIIFQGEKTMTGTATRRANTNEAQAHSEGIVACND